MLARHAMSYRRCADKDSHASSTSKSNADAGEGAVEAERFRFARVDPHIHRAEEKIRAITKAYFGVLDTIGRAREAADIGYGDGAIRICGRRGDSDRPFDSLGLPLVL